MTAGELIEKLKAFPPDTRVFYEDYEGISAIGFDLDTVEFHDSDPPVDSHPEGAYRAAHCERCRIAEGRDKPWVVLK